MGVEASVVVGGNACRSSFSTLTAYIAAVTETPTRLTERFTAVSTAEAEIFATADNHMQRRLRWVDVMAMGVGGMMGAGILVTTGQAAHVSAGPAVVVSYAIAGLSALLSALCYTELAVHIPSAGGAFSYLRITLGEFAAYLTGANLLMEYVISNAVVARNFTSYLATVFEVSDPDTWRVKAEGLSPGYNMLDFPALAVIILLTICICWSTKMSCKVNVVMTLFHLALIAFILVSGFANGYVRNLTKPGNPNSPGGFAPFGAKGIFNGAALVYFSYIGYDAVSTMAEEVQKPSKTMPIGIAGSVVFVTFLYCLMAAAIVMLLPYDQIDATAPFSLALRQKAGWKWASKVVGVGACVGILSSLLVAMLGQARYLCVIGRANVIPSWFARINSRTGTPLNASIVLGCCTAIVALFTEMHILLDLIAIGTLFVFYMVANALIFRRHVLSGVTNPWPTIAFMISISCISIGFVMFWQMGGGKATGLALGVGAALVLTLVFKALVPTVDRMKEWEAPLMPFLAVASILLNVFLMGSIKVQAFVRFGIWSAASLLFYLAYSVHASHDASNAIKSVHTKPLVDKGPPSPNITSLDPQ